MTVFEMSKKPSGSAADGNVAKNLPKPLPPPAWLEKASSNGAVTITFHGYMILLVLSYVITSSGAAYGLMAPFYPREAEKKGLTATQYGAVFAIYQVVAFFCSPFLGMLAMRMTPKVFIQTSIIVSAYCTCLFGILNWTDAGTNFFVLSMVVRVFWALGGAGVTTGGYILGTLLFPHHVSQVYATLEMCFGLGFIIGPSIGGFIYQVGGFFLPFFLVSLLQLIACYPIHRLIKQEIDPKKKNTDEKPVGIWKTLGVPGVWVNLIISMSACMCFGFTETTLDYHIRELGDFSPAESGLVFLVLGLCYSISSQVWGLIARKKLDAFPLIIYGFLLVIISFSFVGPFPFIPIESSIFLVVVSQITFGFGMGNIFVLSFDDVIKEAKTSISTSDSTIAMISGLYSASYALGNSIGPALGGYLLEHYGYKVSTIPFALEMAVLSVLVIGYILWKKRRDCVNSPC